MKTILLILLTAFCLLSPLYGTVTLEIREARDIEIHEVADTARNVVTEDARIVFEATAVVHVLVISGADEEGGSMINGQSAMAFSILAKNCRFTLSKPRLAGEGAEETIEQWWKDSVHAFESLREGKTNGQSISISFNQPSIDIRHSLAKRIAGAGVATLGGNEGRVEDEQNSEETQ